MGRYRDAARFGAEIGRAEPNVRKHVFGYYADALAAKADAAPRLTRWAWRMLAAWYRRMAQ